MSEKELVESLVKEGVSNFISEYLPKSKSELEECWNEFLEQFHKNKCNGFYGYHKDNHPYMLYNDEVITLKNVDFAVDHYFNIFKKVVTLDIIKQLNGKVLEIFNGIDPDNISEEYLDNIEEIESNGVKITFNYDSEDKIVLSSHLLNKYGGVEKVIILDVTCSDTHVKTSDMDKVIDSTVHFNLECMANENICPNTYTLNTIHIMLDHLNYENTIVESVSKEFNSTMVFELTKHKITQKIESFINDSVNHYLRKP